MKKAEIDESERCLKDPVYFMEKQANRAGYALMLPESHTRRLIEAALGEVRYSRHDGEKFEIDLAVGDEVAVIGGAWKDYSAKVKAVNQSKQTVTIDVDLFGRATPVEINFADVRKVD